MTEMEQAVAYLGTLDREMLEMEQVVRRDIDHITGIADLDRLTKRSEQDAQWRRFHMAIEPIRQQRAALVKAMVNIMASLAPPPVILSTNPLPKEPT